MSNVLSSSAANASAATVPLSTSKPMLGRSFYYDMKITAPFCCRISRQDAKILFGDLGEYEAPEWKKFQVLCKPGEKVEFGSAVAVHWGGNDFLIGVVETRRPDRSKTYRIRFLRDGTLSDHTVKCESVFPVIALAGFRSF